MKLKKINAITALAVILSALAHIGVMTYSLWTGWYNYRICKMLPRTALTFLLIHILLSIVIFFFSHDGADVKYKRLNTGTTVQRITAIIMMIFIHFHTNAYAHVAAGKSLTAGMTIFRIITELIFFTSVLSHTAVSLGKAFITLGIASSERSVQNISRAAYVICAAVLLAAASGAVVFYVKGII